MKLRDDTRLETGQTGFFLKSVHSVKVKYHYWLETNYFLVEQWQLTLKELSALVENVRAARIMWPNFCMVSVISKALNYSAIHF